MGAGHLVGCRSRTPVQFLSALVLALHMSGCALQSSDGHPQPVVTGPNFALDYPEDEARRSYTTERLGHWPGAEQARRDEIEERRRGLAPSVADGRKPDPGTGVDLGGGGGQAPGLAPKPKSKPGSAPAATVPPWRYGVFLASYRSRSRALTGWRQLLAEHGQVLGDALPIITRTAAAKDNRVFFRVIAGPLDDQSAARRMCERLETRGQYCRVAHSSGRIEW